jgi:hypothetical protein
VTRFRLNDTERDLVLAGLFELQIARAEDQELGERIVALVERLGGDRYAVFFGAYKDSLGAAPVPEYRPTKPTRADAPAALSGNLCRLARDPDQSKSSPTEGGL